MLNEEITMSEKPKPKLTPKEIETLANMDHSQERNWRPSREELTKLTNTIEALENDLKSARGLKRFITPGVLVCDRLVLFANPDDYRSNIGVRAFTDTTQVRVDLTIAEARRMRRLLMETIKAAQKKRNLIKLRNLAKEKKGSSRYY